MTDKTDRLTNRACAVALVLLLCMAAAKMLPGQCTVPESSQYAACKVEAAKKASPAESRIAQTKAHKTKTPS